MLAIPSQKVDSYTLNAFQYKKIRPIVQTSSKRCRLVCLAQSNGNGNGNGNGKVSSSSSVRSNSSTNENGEETYIEEDVVVEETQDAPNASENGKKTQSSKDKAFDFKTILDSAYSAINTIDLRGRWEYESGNYILRPKPGVIPKALIHFIGGAFVGSAPHITYQYFLESLSDRGYVICASPFQIGFNHLIITEEVLSNFEMVAVSLALDYGELPIVSVGHSSGALIHSIAMTLFPSCQRAGSILISFNNKEVSKAIPFYKELLMPFVNAVYAAQRQNPSLRESIQDLLRVPSRIEAFAKQISEQEYVPKFFGTQLLPTLQETRSVLSAIEPCFDEIADGAVSFYPNAENVCDAIVERYSTDHTLVVKFMQDPLDESDLLYDLLQQNVTAQCTMKQLTGSHGVPAMQDIFLKGRIPILEETIPNVLLQAREPARNLILRPVNELIDVVDDWIEEKIDEGVL